MNPGMHTPWTRIKKQCHTLLKRIDFAIHEKKESLFFHRSQTGFAPTTIASLARLRGDMLVISVGMVRHCEGCQEVFKLCLIQACKGAERRGVVFELLIREHGC
jgi:hypothetical protein